jgi:hypothetical protein
MLSALRKLGFWLLRKLGGGVLIVALGLATYGLWLFVQDDFDFGTQKAELLAVLTGKHTQLLAARGDVERRIVDLRTEAAALQQRGQQADRVLTALRGRADGGRNFSATAPSSRATPNGASAWNNCGAARARVAELQKQMAAAIRTKEAFDLALDRLDRRIQEVQQSESRIVHYLRVAWDHAGWYVVAVLLVWFLGPPLANWDFTLASRR